MNNDLIVAETEAVIRAQAVARDARLREQARGRPNGTSILWLALSSAALVGYAQWVKPSFEACVGFMLLLSVVGWESGRLSRRIDAILELLEKTERPSES